jgi:hypothetical protein
MTQCFHFQFIDFSQIKFGFGSENQKIRLDFGPIPGSLIPTEFNYWLALGF